MSTSGSLSSALSGLNVASRRAEIVASNIANATTKGYGRRVLETMARSVGSSGQGVMITGIRRMVNMNVVGERRLSEADAGNKTAIAEFYRTLEGMVGSPDDAQSLNGRINTFDSALLTATSHPESEARLDQVAEAAHAMVTQINRISDKIQSERAGADAEIANQVAQLNSTLQRVSDLNVQIRSNSGAGSDPSALMDQRQQLIDSISAIVPVRELQRGDGQIALMTTGGLMLLDGGPARIDFQAVGVIAPGMSVASGALSSLVVNGRTIDATSPNSPLGGGSLAAEFQIRDVDGVDAQTRIDAVARDLVERFQDPALDLTRAPGAPGLFTDGIGAFDATNEVGLAQRLRLSPIVDPEAGGQLWHLRDGLGAPVPGITGNSGLLADLQAALNAARNPASGNFMQGARSFSELAGDVTSIIASSRLTADGDAAYSTSRADAMQQLENENGVDTDAEMQDLLQIEQAYSANAKVMKTVDEMIRKLLEM
jgi:flagellar hook-associated protein 1